jgi:hypothetical protein
LTAACLAAAAHSYQLPPVYLYAILKTEGGQVGQAVHNTNGTWDLGPFQINSAWGPAISQYWHIPVLDALLWVRDNGCANATIAAAILKKYLNETKGNYPKAIGYYHSHTEALAAVYRKAVLNTAASLLHPAGPVYRVPTPHYITKLAPQLVGTPGNSDSHHPAKSKDASSKDEPCSPLCFVR